jgi:hypothetical protein
MAVCGLCVGVWVCVNVSVCILRPVSMSVLGFLCMCVFVCACIVCLCVHPSARMLVCASRGVVCSSHSFLLLVVLSLSRRTRRITTFSRECALCWWIETTRPSGTLPRWRRYPMKTWTSTLRVWAGAIWNCRRSETL